MIRHELNMITVRPEPVEGQCFDSSARTNSRINLAGSISIRKLDDDTIARLRIRATYHQVSMEEEARRILRQALTPSKRLGDLSLQLFGAESGVEPELPQHASHDPLSFTR